MSKIRNRLVHQNMLPQQLVKSLPPSLGIGIITPVCVSFIIFSWVLTAVKNIKQCLDNLIFLEDYFIIVPISCVLQYSGPD
jgi:hypothetical protein